MARRKLRSQADVLERVRSMQEELRAALAALPSDDPAVVDAVWRGEALGTLLWVPAVVDAVWRGEALGTLLWALQLAELPPYDRPFEPDDVAAAELEGAALREQDEIELERETARLWHWRARTTELQAAGSLELPPRY